MEKIYSERIQSMQAVDEMVGNIVKTLESLGALELYNLKADRYQLDNIAESTSPGLPEKLQAWLEALRHCKGESCREIEAQPSPYWSNQS